MFTSRPFPTPLPWFANSFPWRPFSVFVLLVPAIGFFISILSFPSSTRRWISPWPPASRQKYGTPSSSSSVRFSVFLLTKEGAFLVTGYHVFDGPLGLLLHSFACTAHFAHSRCNSPLFHFAHSLVGTWNSCECVHAVNTFNRKKRVFHLH